MLDMLNPIESLKLVANDNPLCSQRSDMFGCNGVCYFKDGFSCQLLKYAEKFGVTSKSWYSYDFPYNTQDVARQTLEIIESKVSNIMEGAGE